MWTCPKCNNRFFNKNQEHSCGTYTVAKFLEGNSDTAIQLFHLFIAEYRKVGPFTLHPAKTRVALLAKMRFCSINRLGRDFINVHFVLTEPADGDSVFHRIDNLSNRFFVHHLRIRSKADLSREVRRVMKLAYAVGRRMHVNGR